MAQAVRPLTAGNSRVQEKAVAGKADGVDFPSSGVFQQDPQDDGVKVEVEVAVDVIERKAGGVEFFELGGDFVAELFSAAWGEEKFHAGGGGVFGELAGLCYQSRNFFGRKSRASANQGEMKADAEAGILAGEFHGAGGCRFVDHQACGGEDAFLVGANDGFVDGIGAPKIVGVDNQAALAGSFGSHPFVFNL